MEEAIDHRGTSAHGLRRGVDLAAPINPALQAADLPANWARATISKLLAAGVLLDVKDGNHGGVHPKTSELGTEGLPFIAANRVKNGHIDYDGAPRVGGTVLARLKVGFSLPGDVILTHKGSVGRVAIATQESVLTPQTTYYRCADSILAPGYLAVFLLSSHFQKQLAAVMGQTTRDFVPIGEQYLLSVPVPPPAEQELIVSKANELMGVCDELEASLASGFTYREQLLEGLLLDALAKCDGPVALAETVV